MTRRFSAVRDALDGLCLTQPARAPRAAGPVPSATRLACATCDHVITVDARACAQLGWPTCCGQPMVTVLFSTRWQEEGQT